VGKFSRAPKTEFAPVRSSIPVERPLTIRFYSYPISIEVSEVVLATGITGLGTG
jgi:hypothetical protein